MYIFFVSFRGQKNAWATPRSVSFRGLIQNFPRASPPISYAESPPLGGLTVLKLIKLTHEQGLKKCGSESMGLWGVMHLISYKRQGVKFINLS